jgi:hypothetical protein
MLSHETLVNTYPDSSYARRAEVELHDSRIANCGESWSTSSGGEVGNVKTILMYGIQ